ncbi:MAG TPA: class F sortase [Aeromicrobium sp.]|nr:class F sortase [Aeromicrobium sp.]
MGADEAWQQPRLIPTSGSTGTDGAAGRAASAFLAVLPAVREYSRTLLGGVGAPAGTIETFVEVSFTLGEKVWRPDGLIRVTRGSKSWVALVAVKTGQDVLMPEQVEAYLDIARRNKFDALITISNQITTAETQPSAVDMRKLRTVQMHHWSWAYLVSAAVQQKELRAASDPHQAWLLGELVRYLEHPNSGALTFDDMGGAWLTVRERVHTGTLRAGDKQIPAATARFDALLTYSALRLSRHVGSEVRVQLSRKELADPSKRQAALKASLLKEGTLSGAIKIPGAIGDIVVTADLRTRQVTAHVDIGAPKTGRPTTQVNWLTRQLKEAPGALRVEAFAAKGRGSGAATMLSAAREDAQSLVVHPKKELRSFRVAKIVPMGTKRGRGRRSFIDSVLEAIDGLYEDVVQQFEAWAASPPKYREAVGGDLLTEEAAAPDDTNRPQHVRMRRSRPVIRSWLLNRSWVVVLSVALTPVATAGALGVASSFDEPGKLRAAKVGVVQIPDSCEKGATKPFTPTSIDIQDVRNNLPILAMARDDNDVPGVPPAINAGNTVAWDRPPSGLQPGSPRGNVLLNAHTGRALDGVALGNEMLAKVDVGDVIKLRDRETHLCYRVTERIEMSADEEYKPFYAQDGPPQFAFVVCSGERIGPGEWTKRTIWFGRPIGTTGR